MIVAQTAEEFLPTLDGGSVHLAVLDPPYYKIVDDAWDHQWETLDEYLAWFDGIMGVLRPKLAPDGSVILFGAIGKHGTLTLSKVRELSERHLFYRNWITWGKRRGRGTQYNYLWTREEILWFTVSSEPSGVRFNVPYLSEKRGHDGWSKKYPARSEYKRRTNVWTDIGELMLPERSCQKPLKLLRVIIEAHSHKGDLVIDPFSGWGTTGVMASVLGRKFSGCEPIAEDAAKGNERIRLATQQQTMF